jgi:predicted glycogen debranching enzyme
MDSPYEHERGLNGTEDHYIPGYYEIELKPGEEKTFTMVCSAGEEIDTLDGEAMIAEEISRQKALRVKGRMGKDPGEDPFLDQLLEAADKFIVHRKSTNAKTVIAAYPWFTDWGRDTMIAMPGLTLSTGRYEDARDILLTFARYEKDGLIPNVFPDGEGEPAYNTVDAALWYFEAVYRYLQVTKDLEFVQEHLLPVLERIIQGYQKGTCFQIGMQKDSLIAAGNEDTQLTWMDAKAGSWVVTPRHGKAVEINALWYNALRVMTEITGQCGADASAYQKLAEKVKKSFQKVFWNEKANCLFDVVNEQGSDEKIRPNQILAVSLSFPVLSGEKAKGVVDKVHQKLYTALGLRTLNMEDPQYRGIYLGDQYARDGAYHQGTVWTWPLGRFITAYARVHAKEPGLKKQLEAFFLPFQDHLRDGCIGSISEIFDGNEPLLPRGCCAQAWSVSEILRAYVEDYLPLCK